VEQSRLYGPQASPLKGQHDVVSVVS